MVQFTLTLASTSLSAAGRALGPTSSSLDTTVCFCLKPPWTGKRFLWALPSDAASSAGPDACHNPVPRRPATCPTFLYFYNHALAVDPGTPKSHDGHLPHRTVSRRYTTNKSTQGKNSVTTNEIHDKVLVRLIDNDVASFQSHVPALSSCRVEKHLWPNLRDSGHLINDARSQKRILLSANILSWIWISNWATSTKKKTHVKHLVLRI